MGIAEGKVAIITGVARGQGRSHALRLASEGADIIGMDICEDIPTMNYPNANDADLQETVKLVEGLGRKIIARKADVRDAAAVKAVTDEGFDAFGRIDIALSNAGIIRLGAGPVEDEPQTWLDVLNTNLSGAYYLIRAVAPRIIEGGRGGSIILTGSTAALRPSVSHEASATAYTASKFGLVGLGKQWAAEYAPHSIRVNVIHPTGVISGMTMNAAMAAMQEEAMKGGANTISAMQNALPIDILPPEEISNTVAFLVSDQAQYITGVSLPVDAGFAVR